MLAVGFSIGGVVLIVYSEGFGSFGAIGILLAAGNAITAAVYRVIYMLNLVVLHSVVYTVLYISLSR